MRKFYLFSLLLSVTIVACSKDVSEQPCCATNDDVALSCKGSTIPVEQALKNLDDLVNVLYPETRTRKAKTYSKESVLTYVTHATTRSSSKIELPDTLVYIVNFDDGEGFALLGAQSNLSSVYSITESGTFDVNKFSEALNYEIEHNLLTPEEYAARIAAEQEEVVEYGVANNEDIAYNIMASAVLIDSTGPLPWEPSPEDPPIIDGGTILPPIPISTEVDESWEFVEKYDPLLTTEWTQWSPFNLKCKDSEGNICPAGCVVIAVAQIMAYHEFPQNVAFNGVLVDWNTVKQYNKSMTYDDDSAIATQLSNLCFELGKPENCDISYSTSGSSTTAQRAKVTLNNYGFKNVDKRYGFGSADIEKIRIMIKNNKPVYVGACKSMTKGHALVADGYVKRKLKTTKVYHYANGTSSTSFTYGEEEQLIHYNWGYAGLHNGYYVAKAEINSDERYPYEDSDECIADSDDPRDYRYYNKFFRVITYDL